MADDLGDAVSLILDGGACAVGIESTIVAFVGGAPVLLRPGGIARRRPRARARAVARDAPTASAPRAPGTLPAHYAPRTPAILVAPDALRAEIVQLEERDEEVAVLARTVARPADFDDAWLQRAADTRPPTRTISTRTCACSTPRTPMSS